MNALSAALLELIELGLDGRKKLGLAARNRVRQHYDLPNIVVQYESLYEELARGRPL